MRTLKRLAVRLFALSWWMWLILALWFMYRHDVTMTDMINPSSFGPIPTHGISDALWWTTTYTYLTYVSGAMMLISLGVRFFGPKYAREGS